MGKIESFLAVTLLAAVAVSVTGCREAWDGSRPINVDPYYITGSRESREQLQNLFVLLSEESDSAENTFAVIREIANTLAKKKEYGRLINFLSERTINFPDDPYNSYYLLMIAYAYTRKDSLPVAVRYFDLIVKNYPDLTVNGESIHLICLNRLIELTDNPEQQVWYYQELISRFPEDIDLGAAWFFLARAYERIGDWNGAIQAYTNFGLPKYAGTVIPGFPNAEIYARHQVFFYNSSKNWTYDTLPALLSDIQVALDSADYRELGFLQAKVNFFTRSWEQVETDASGIVDFTQSDFMRGNPIRYANNLDPSSTATEAFLRTWGWPQYISTWYLYFRKINFPPDPDIHGRWEWAGVYYGEKY